MLTTNKMGIAFEELFAYSNGSEINHNSIAIHRERGDTAAYFLDKILYGETPFETIRPILSHP